MKFLITWILCIPNVTENLPFDRSESSRGWRDRNSNTNDVAIVQPRGFGSVERQVFSDVRYITSCFANNNSEWINSLLERGSELKKQGLWEEHIQFGEAAIQECKERSLLKEEAQLSTQLASTYFYRGNYLRTKALAERSFAIYTERD